jgi:hypothetical protein
MRTGGRKKENPHTHPGGHTSCGIPVFENARETCFSFMLPLCANRELATTY